MAVFEAEPAAARRNRLMFGAAALLTVGVALILYFILRPPPQMGTSEEVFATVDALYTAVRNEDEKRLGECEQRLRAYREAAKLPPDAADRLDAIIATARSGAWRPAAESLYDFMKGQRRDGPAENGEEREKNGKRARKK